MDSKSHRSTAELWVVRREAGRFSGMRNNQNTKAEAGSTMESARGCSEVEWSHFPQRLNLPQRIGLGNASLLELPVALTVSAREGSVTLSGPSAKAEGGGVSQAGQATGP